MNATDWLLIGIVIGIVIGAAAWALFEIMMSGENHGD